MVIRKLGPDDAELVLASGHLFDQKPDPAATRRFITSGTHHLFVAFEDGLAVGFVTGVEMTHPDKGTEMFLYELAVAEDHRRRGVGSALVETLRDTARALGCYGMWVLTDEDNMPAMGTYRKAGGSPDSKRQTMLSWAL